MVELTLFPPNPHKACIHLYQPVLWFLTKFLIFPISTISVPLSVMDVRTLDVRAYGVLEQDLKISEKLKYILILQLLDRQGMIIKRANATHSQGP